MTTKPTPIESVAPLTCPNTGASATGAVTKSDVTVFPYATRALWVGGTGNLVLTMGGATVTLLAVPVGLYALSCTQVLAATTATNIVALN